MIDAEIQGVKEIERLFKQLETKESAKAVRSSTRITQKETNLKDAKSNASSMVGGNTGKKIARNLVVRAMTGLKRGHYGIKVMIKPTDAFVVESKDEKRYYIPTAIEYGHGYPGRSGNKDVKPIPFMRNAFEKNRHKVVNVLRKYTLNKLDEFVRRNGSKA